MKFKGTKIFNPRKPRCYLTGGAVSKSNNMTRRQLQNDSVLAVLQPGEAVIPVKYYHKGASKPIRLADRVLSELKKQKIRLPGA